ncbi:nucleoside deaminase [Chlamydiifrater volucris]|uniref:nucleoside deaminase n=1 Tax=Chlamydiifrater volucris TaxID=2681470 RepID=UPI001BD0D725|nr:nucleoside deaminase [Chlamydiifrater volucris]
MISEEDRRFMLLALKEAEKAYAEDEVPVGCVIVKDGRVIARGYNRVESLLDPTAHAEILCIGAAAQALDNWRLSGADIYITLEPCPMCAGAIQLARLSRVIWGAPDLRLGAGGTWVNLLAEKHPFHTVKCVSGVEKEASEYLMKKFFLEKRKKSGEE